MQARLSRALCARAVFALAPAWLALPAYGQSLANLNDQVLQLKRNMAEQHQQIADQAKLIARQQDAIAILQRLLPQAEVRVPPVRTAAIEPPPLPSPARAQPIQSVRADPELAAQPMSAIPDLPIQPVGGALEIPKVEQTVAAVLTGEGVLTPAHHFVIEPSFEFTNSASNLLVFNGVELIPGVQVGQIEASNADHNTLIAAGTFRYGLSNSAEFELRVPYVYRADTIQGIQQGEDTVVQQSGLTAHGIGDIEIGLRYQLNHPIGENPIFIASLRVKSDSGKSPYAVPFDQYGVAQGLSTGSGFWAVQPGVSFLLPSDPVVIYGGASFIYQVPRNIDRTVGSVLVGKVEPGDVLSSNLGFAFALNRRFSFSLGYQHSYILPTISEIGGGREKANSLQIGTLMVGMSYRLSNLQAVSFGIAIGATKDAPGVNLVLRAPFYTK